MAKPCAARVQQIPTARYGHRATSAYKARHTKLPRRQQRMRLGQDDVYTPPARTAFHKSSFMAQYGAIERWAAAGYGVLSEHDLPAITGALAKELYDYWKEQLARGALQYVGERVRSGDLSADFPEDFMNVQRRMNTVGVLWADVWSDKVQQAPADVIALWDAFRSAAVWIDGNTSDADFNPTAITLTLPPPFGEQPPPRGKKKPALGKAGMLLLLLAAYLLTKKKR